MRYYFILATSVLCGLFNFTVKGELTQKCKEAIYKEDVMQMLTEANLTPDNESAVIDVLCSDIDLNNYSYEQLKQWQPIPKSEVISKMLNNTIKRKELEIINEVRGLTAYEFVAYSTEFPGRTQMLSFYTDSILLPNIKDLSLKELICLDDYFSDSFHNKVFNEIASRDAEISEILNDRELDYQRVEKILTERLKYLIEYNLWTYFVEGHKALNNSYSEIGIVPDNPNIAADQYQRLVHICFPTQKIRETLQNEVDRYSNEINEVRKAYYMAAGKKNYPKMSYKVPEFRISSNASVEPLNGISEARERFIRNREDISTGTSVIGWIFGGVAGLIAKGIGDWMAIDGLVTSEFNARKKYMDGVQKKLLTSFANYSNTVISGIDKSL